MKRTAFVLLVSGLLFLTSCKKETTEISTKEQTKETSFSGMFSGTLPCADCMGISTSITFKPNGKLVKGTMYLDSDDTCVNENGTWSKNDSIVEVKVGKNPIEYYAIQSNTSIAKLDQNKKQITGALSKNYILNKTEIISSKAIKGEYVDDIKKIGYYQTLSIKAINDSIYDVNITFKGLTKKGCTFKGKGQLINNQIDIQLKNIFPELKGTMTIQFKDNNKIADVFTTKFEERFDLMYFCGGGGSLAGEYTKQ